MDNASSKRFQLCDILIAGGPATAKDLAEKAGIAYSTTTALLRKLAAGGRVSKLVSSDHGPDRWQYTGNNPTAAAPTTGEPATGPTPATAAGDDEARPAGIANDASSSRDDTEDSEQPPQVPDSDTVTDAGQAPATVPPQPGRQNGAALPRLHRGQLRTKVLSVLQDNPDDAFTPRDVSKRLEGRSDGAIANALDKLVEHGNAELVCERPRRFQAI